MGFGRRSAFGAVSSNMLMIGGIGLVIVVIVVYLMMSGGSDASAPSASVVLGTPSSVESQAKEEVLDWSNSNEEKLSQALSWINMFNIEGIANNIKLDGQWIKQVDWANAAYKNPDLKYSPDVAKIVIKNRDGSLTNKQVAAISSKFNIPIPN